MRERRKLFKKETQCVFYALAAIWFLSSGFFLSWTQDTTIPVTGFEIERKVQGGTGAVIAKIRR